MADRPNVLEASYFGVEVTPGTAVPPTKKLLSLGLTIGPSFTFRTVQPTGSKVATAVVPGKEQTAIRWTAANNFYEDLVWVLNSTLKDVTPTRIIPSTGLAYKWDYAPAATALDAHKTYTLEHGSAAGAERVTGLKFNNSIFNWDREGCSASGDAFGRAMENGYTLTGTPSDSDNTPVTGNTVDVFADPSSATIGTTRLTRAFTGTFTIPGHFGQIWPLDSTLSSYAADVEQSMPATFMLRMGADAAATARLTQARNGDRVFIRSVLKGPLIETGTPNNYYLFQIDICGEISAISPQADQDGITAYDFTFTCVEDPTWAKPFELTVVNKLATLA